MNNDVDFAGSSLYLNQSISIKFKLILHLIIPYCPFLCFRVFVDLREIDRARPCVSNETHFSKKKKATAHYEMCNEFLG